MTATREPNGGPEAVVPALRDRTLADAPLRIGAVTLIVRDVDAMTRFYRDVIGLATLRQDGASVTLGAGGAALLVLRHEPEARPWSQREAGLFHMAFLLPRRADLGAWLRHVATRRFPITGASDHIVSEAVYLTDPEGNGIEVYADRPSTAWQHADGLVVMSTSRLDLERVMEAADRPWSGMPPLSCVGHVHLQTGDLERAGDFYGGLLGLTVMARYPGALFWGAGGYHHQIATNVWNSRGAPPRIDRTSGLAEVELLAAGEAVIEAIRGRLGDAIVADGEAGLVARDPWGTAFRIAAGPATGG